MGNPASCLKFHFSSPRNENAGGVSFQRNRRVVTEMKASIVSVHRQHDSFSIYFTFSRVDTSVSSALSRL